MEQFTSVHNLPPSRNISRLILLIFLEDDSDY